MELDTHVNATQRRIKKHIAVYTTCTPDLNLLQFSKEQGIHQYINDND